MIIQGTILIELDQAKKVTKGGILLPEAMATENNIATVLEVGAATENMEPEVSVGDQIVFNHKSYRKKEFELDGKDVARIGFQDVFLINKK